MFSFIFFLLQLISLGFAWLHVIEAMQGITGDGTDAYNPYRRFFFVLSTLMEFFIWLAVKSERSYTELFIWISMLAWLGTIFSFFFMSIIRRTRIEEVMILRNVMKSAAAYTSILCVIIWMLTL